MDRTNAGEPVNDETLPPSGEGGEEHETKTPTNGHDEGGDPDTEARARRMGWRPPEEFDDSMVAKPRKMLSASDYIAKVESDLPILRERNRFLDTTVGKLEKQLTESASLLKGTNERVSELGTLVEDLHKQNVEVGKRAYNRAKRELQDQIDAAVRDSDPEAVRQLTSEMVDLEKQKPIDAPAKKPPEKPADEPATKPSSQQLSPAARTWIEANQKIMSDRRLNPVAVAIHTENLESGMTEEQSFAKLADQVKEEMPHKFENQRRNAPAAVASSSPPARAQKKKGFESVPEKDKETFARMKKFFKSKGVDYTEKEFAENYWLNIEGAT